MVSVEKFKEIRDEFKKRRQDIDDEEKQVFKLLLFSIFEELIEITEQNNILIAWVNLTKSSNYSLRIVDLKTKKDFVIADNVLSFFSGKGEVEIEKMAKQTPHLCHLETPLKEILEKINIFTSNLHYKKEDQSFIIQMSNGKNMHKKSDLYNEFLIYQTKKELDNTLQQGIDNKRYKI